MKTNLEMEMPKLNDIDFFKKIYFRFLHFCPKPVKGFLPQYSVRHLEQELTHTLQAQRIIFNTLHQKII